MWAMGVVAYELLYGALPFGLGADPSEDFECVEDRIVREPLVFPEQVAEAEAAGGAAAAEAAAARAFCERLLTREPAERPTAIAFARCSPYVRGASLTTVGAALRKPASPICRMAAPRAATFRSKWSGNNRR